MSISSTSAANRALRQVPRVAVDSDHAGGAPAFHFHGIEAGVAADVEHRTARQVSLDRMCEPLPVDGGIVSEDMRRRGLHPFQIDVVKPRAQLGHTAANALGRQNAGGHDGGIFKGDGAAVFGARSAA
jgi:hypothetical protein